MIGAADRVFVTAGTSEGIEIALTALVDDTGEVLVPMPTYPLYTAVLAKLDSEMINVMVLETVKSLESEADAKAAGKKFYDLQKAGKPAPTSEQAIQPYFILGMNTAEELKDAAVFEGNLKALKAKFADNPQAKKFFEAKEKKLEELKAEKK